MNHSTEQFPHESQLKTDFTREWQRDYYKKLIAEYIAIRGQHTLPELLSTKDNSLLPILRAVFAKLEQIFAFAREHEIPAEVRIQKLKDWASDFGFVIQENEERSVDGFSKFTVSKIDDSKMVWSVILTDAGRLVLANKAFPGNVIDMSEEKDLWLPDNLKIEGSLKLDNSNIRKLPSDLWVLGNLSLLGCHDLEDLPEDLCVGSQGALNVMGCRPQVVDRAKQLKDDGSVGRSVLTLAGTYDGNPGWY